MVPVPSLLPRHGHRLSMHRDGILAVAIFYGRLPRSVIDQLLERALTVPKTMLTDGSPVPEDWSHTKLRADGQQEGYIVLTPEERAKGYVRPVRRSYIHQKCGCLTTMGQSLAETYARDPSFYSGTFCCGYGAHFPVGEKGEFVWADSDEKVGT